MESASTAAAARPTAPASPAPPALPRRAQLLFSLSSLGGEALTQSRAAWLLYSYAPPADSGREQLLPLGLVGLLLGVLQVVGALDDALIGWWSDRVRSPLGRRVPFVLAGTPLMALFAVLIVTPPADAGTATTAVYLFVTMELYAVFSSLSGGPYEALLPEIARTSADRVALVGVRVFFGVAGAGLGLVLSGPLVDAVGVRWMMAVMAALAFGCRYAGLVGVWRHVDRERPPAVIPFRTALASTLRNTQFLAFLPTFVLFQTGLGMLTGVLPYYAGAILGVENEGTWVSILTAIAIAAMLAAVPLFTRIARRRSKRDAYGRAMLLAGLAFPLLFLAGFLPGVPPLAQVLVVMALVGAPQAGVYLFPAALTADIADHDATQTGLRREATYFGVQNFVERSAGALAPLTLAGLLALGNTAADPLGIRLVGPAAGGFVLLGALLFRSYTLPDEIPPPDPATHPGRAPSRPTRSASVAP